MGTNTSGGRGLVTRAKSVARTKRSAGKQGKQAAWTHAPQLRGQPSSTLSWGLVPCLVALLAYMVTARLMKNQISAVEGEMFKWCIISICGGKGISKLVDRVGK
jgi:hypothetical protein